MKLVRTINPAVSARTYYKGQSGKIKQESGDMGAKGSLNQLSQAFAVRKEKAYNKQQKKFCRAELSDGPVS
ncbi:MAG: hypothetical protein LUE23_08540 [Lachnospiraceae bacterium]|nr:hypothetical protein [Lachnospiraceae bacterium]